MKIQDLSHRHDRLGQVVMLATRIEALGFEVELNEVITNGVARKKPGSKPGPKPAKKKTKHSLYWSRIQRLAKARGVTVTKARQIYAKENA